MKRMNGKDTSSEMFQSQTYNWNGTMCTHSLRYSLALLGRCQVSTLIIIIVIVINVSNLSAEHIFQFVHNDEDEADLRQTSKLECLTLRDHRTYLCVSIAPVLPRALSFFLLVRLSLPRCIILIVFAIRLKRMLLFVRKRKEI